MSRSALPFPLLRDELTADTRRMIEADEREIRRSKVVPLYAVPKRAGKSPSCTRARDTNLPSGSRPSWATIATRERRLLDALGDGDATVAASIKGRLRDELSRRDALAAELARLETVTPVDTDALVQAAASRAADLRGLLRWHPAQARQVLRLVVGEGRFTCTPFDDASGRGFDLQAEATIPACSPSVTSTPVWSGSGRSR